VLAEIQGVAFLFFFFGHVISERNGLTRAPGLSSGQDFNGMLKFHRIQGWAPVNLCISMLKCQSKVAPNNCSALLKNKKNILRNMFPFTHVTLLTGVSFWWDCFLFFTLWWFPRMQVTHGCGLGQLGHVACPEIKLDSHLFLNYQPSNLSWRPAYCPLEQWCPGPPTPHILQEKSHDNSWFLSKDQVLILCISLTWIRTYAHR